MTERPAPAASRWRRFATDIIRLLFAVFVRPWVAIRVENVPNFAALGPVVLAPNHVSFLDPPVLQWACGRTHLSFLMTEVIYRVSWIRWLFRLWGAIPIPKEGSAVAAMKAGLAEIRSGRPVVIFPEGGIQPDGLLGEGRGGVVTLIARGGVPVIPVAIIGTYAILPQGRLWPRPGRVLVRFGSPIDPPQRPSREEIDAFAERVMAQIAALGLARRPPAPEGSASGELAQEALNA